ncbi:hypothetical protein GCM10028791_35990 [Echinicola sediminis]
MGSAQTNPSIEMGRLTNNPTGNGPTSSVDIYLHTNTNNPSGNTFVDYTENLMVTISLENDQYPSHPHNTNGNSGDSNNPSSVIGWYFGNNTSDLLYPTINYLSSPSNANFTALPDDAAGTGISIADNRGVLIAHGVSSLNGQPVSGKYYMHDLTLTFNMPVTDPVVHFSGLGASFSSIGCTAELELITSGITVQRLSGNTNFQVSGNDILNTAANPRANSSGAAHGSILLEGEDITTVTFKVYTRGQSGQSTTNWGSSSTEDGWIVAVSTTFSDMAVTKTVDNEQPELGSDVEFTLQAQNVGPGNNTGVSLLDNLPSGYIYKSHSSSSGTYDQNTGVWDLGAMSGLQTETLTIVATVNGNEDYENIAAIFGDLADPKMSNNRDTASTEPYKVLPNLWLKVNGKSGLKGNVIEWGFAENYQHMFYSIYKSSDGLKSWKIIGEIQGEAKEVGEYSYADPSGPFNQRVYYKIEAKNEQGRVDVSEVISLKSENRTTTDRFYMYPNPHLAGGLTIHLPSALKENIKEVMINNHLGNNAVYMEPCDNISEKLAELLLRLPKGVYQVTVLLKDSSILNWKQIMR